VIEIEGLDNIVFTGNGNDFGQTLYVTHEYYACASPITVQSLVKKLQADYQKEEDKIALQLISLPNETRTDLVLPKTLLNDKVKVTWTSSDESVITSDGVLMPLTADKSVTLTATVGEVSRMWEVKALARDITKNLRYERTEVLDMTDNTASGFAANKYGLAPTGLLTGLRSYTFLVTINAKSLAGQPRIYDFGSGSGNSVFLRANPLSAGIKYNGGTTTMVNSPVQLQTNKEYKLAVIYEAATKTTHIYIDGEEMVAGTANQVEPYELALLAADTRNYIGRTQWWDSSYAADNIDFRGTIDKFQLYDVALTRQEICEIQDIEYGEKELPTALVNGDFEAPYTVMQGSGVSADRAIYVPDGWTIDYANANNNDLTALKSGDLYFSNFFASRPIPSADSKQTYWVRQNWGSSTISLKQELRLPAGKYILTADVWKSGLGGDAVVGYQTENQPAVNAPSLENMEAWQQASLLLESDGKASTTVILSAVHTSNGSEKIIGFDNVRLTAQQPDHITEIVNGIQKTAKVLYDLQGRKIEPSNARKGIYIQQGRKHIIK
jgi:hypothetical protein